MTLDRLVFTYDGKKYHTGDLLLREVEKAEKISGVVYVAHNIKRDMTIKLAYMAVFLMRDHGDAEVEKIIATTTLADGEAMWSEEEDDMPVMYQDGIPSLVGEPGTVTSSGSPNPLDAGLLT